jgi:hypothetical protein
MNSAARSASGLLSHLGILRFTGADALAFLQGQVSNDTRRLAQDTPLLAAFSSPQGRVLALIYLLPHSSGTLALLPRELTAPILERLRKFVLRAKVKIEDVSDALEVAGCHSPADLAASGLNVPAEHGYVERNGLGVARVAGSARFWVVGEAQPLNAAGLTEQAQQAWKLADIHAGLPQVYASTSEAFVAQMLNLDLIDGISFTKGCYTGQEIVERVRSRGHVNRRLTGLLFSSTEVPRPGATVLAKDGNEAGHITSAAFSPLAGRAAGMAYLRREYLEPGTTLQCGNTAAEVIEMPLRAALLNRSAQRPH